MNKNKIKLDFLITAVVFSVFFFENNEYVNYLGVFLFCTSSLGLLLAILSTIKEAKVNFSWKYSLSKYLIIVILLTTNFWPIGLIFLSTETVLSVKKIIGSRISNNDDIYITGKIDKVITEYKTTRKLGDVHGILTFLNYAFNYL